MTKRSSSHWLIGLLWLVCLGGPQLQASSKPAAKHPSINLGIDELSAMDFRYLQGQRVGLLTHPAGVNKHGISTIDILKNSPKVNLVALFGPEHGIYGDEKANVPVDDKIDVRTDLPVYSLYGKYRKPTAAMLAGIDTLVIDLQDIGSRSYTYVSCMRYAMEACFENAVTVMILDRPNPLGGLKVDGPPLEKHLMSYVGAFQVPYVHGLTIAELALMAKKEPGWLDVTPEVQKAGRLILIPMRGWKRSMLWPETGLKWVATSPAIPDLSAALGYAMTGLGTQIGGFSHGYGGPFPFRLLSYPGKSAQHIVDAFNRIRIPGLEFKVKQFSDQSGASTFGALVVVTDYPSLRPTELSFHMMRLADAWSKQGNPFANADAQARRLFQIHVGSETWWQELCHQGVRADIDKFIDLWQRQALAFQEQSKRYYLY